MKIKKLSIILLIVICLFVLAVWALFNTSAGNNLIKLYFQNKITYYFPNMKIDKFSINYNNFFMSLHEGDNHYKLYGQLHPFDAILEGKIKKLAISKNKFKDNVILKGHVDKKYFIHSIVYFDKSVGFLDIKLGKGKIINFKTNNVDLQYIMDNFSIKNIKGLKAKVNLNLLIKNNNYFIKTLIKGLYKNIPFNSNINFYFNSSNFITFEGFTRSEILDGTFKGVYNNKKLVYDADFKKFDLRLLNLIYPFRGKIYLKIRHDKSGIIKFFSKDFRGFKDDNINIEFNMPVQDFFNYAGIYNIFDKGNVIGRIIISKKGSFNFIIQNAFLKEKLANKLKLKNNLLRKIFVKGYFDSQHVVFDLLSDNKKFALNIKNGKIFIKPNIVASFILIVNNNKEEDYYKFNKNKLFLLKKRFLVDDDNQILVF
ncbi:conserved hypothetical protein [Lebetimonas natsushimae]|uniref:AsmA-like C-terminal domain-containing protein n=1 Tax=Lebetimonas natsushimae TaxID=1936991 RepID=A0A292YBP1_9BACT|nr:hypothetical protein [Lebetimonas natsushimae]GAX86825.1 conserved hypothetical protein [Lebetimonas natsushimae]